MQFFSSVFLSFTQCSGIVFEYMRAFQLIKNIYICIISKMKEESLPSVVSLPAIVFLFNSSSHTAVNESLISWTEMSGTF